LSFGDRRTSLHKLADRCLTKKIDDCKCKFHQIISLLLSYKPDTKIRDKDGMLWSDLLVDDKMNHDTNNPLDKSSLLPLTITSTITSPTITSTITPTITSTITSTTNLPSCYICNEAKFAFAKRNGKFVCISCMNDL